ncbi:MAG TPA: glycerophosphodiester phosphodiesterase family protein, partial [Thermomicrobiales bacterium]|nr:glycerophosphodiester phosphodiesterase family protein [Thermomicrobiales bacterium]
MRVYAHRGASIERPENTLSAFRRALELKPAGIELDLQLSRDGVPVVIHDESVDRTTNGSSPVSSFTVAELRELDAGDGEYIPTLREVMDLVASTPSSCRARMILEVKNEDVVPALLAEVSSRADVDWSILSLNWEALRDIRAIDANADLWMNTFGTSDVLRIFQPESPSLRMLDEALEVLREIKASTLA